MERFAKFGLTSLLALLCGTAVKAQTTLVTGTITDPNGLAYAGAQVKAQLVLAGAGVTGQPVVTVNSAAQCASAGQGSAPCKIPFPGTVGPVSADATGKFTLALQDNTQVTPAGTQWLFTVNEIPGVAPPVGTGPQSFSVALTISGGAQDVSAALSAAAPALSKIAGVGSASYGPAYINAASSAYGVKADLKFVPDASWANGQNPVTVTCPNSDCNFTLADTGKRCAGVSGANNTIPVGNFTFVSAQSGTCSSTSSGAATANGTFAWYDDDTPAVLAVQNAWANQVPCASVIWPAGMIAVNKGFFNIPAPANCTFTAGNTLGGIESAGQGFKNTWFVPTPDFDFTTCSSNGCFFAGNTAPGITGLTIRDMSFYGLGYSFSGKTTTAGQLFFINAESKMINVSVLAFATSVTGLGAIKLSGQNSVLQNVWVDNAGTTFGIFVNSPNGLCINCFSGDFSNSANALNIAGAGTTFTSIQSGWGATGGTTAIATMSNGTWISYGDFTEGGNGRCLETSGGTVYFSRFQCYQGTTPAASAIGINWTGGSTAVVHSCGSRFNGGTTFGALHSTAGQTAPTFIEDCNNTIQAANQFAGTHLEGTQLGSLTSTVTTATVGPSTVYAVPSNGAGNYRVCVNEHVTAAGTAGTIAPTISWNNGAAQSVVFPALSLTSANNEYPGTTATNPSCWIVNAGNSTNIQITWTVSGATGTPSTTAVATVEKQ